jgi:hypothetical protein
VFFHGVLLDRICIKINKVVVGKFKKQKELAA